MLKITEQKNGKLKIEANAEIFVIPGEAMPLKGFLDFMAMDKLAKSLCESNGLNFCPDEKMIEVWIISEEDLEDDNITYGFCIPYKNDNLDFKNIAGCDRLNYLPLSLIKDMKEGDQKTIVFRDMKFMSENDFEIKNKDIENIEDFVEGEIISVDLLLTVTAKQQDRRYAYLGDFENAVNNNLKIYYQYEKEDNK